ncbi:MAG: DUF447 domain-containing protein [Pirellulaceae bacterium]
MSPPIAKVLSVILEGLVTTLDEDGSVHLAPMGPDVTDSFDQLVLRPFRTSRTFENLRRTGQGVLHVTDDVELIARAAIGQLLETPSHRPAPLIQGAILEGACRWYAFQAGAIDERAARAVIPCRVVAAGRLRDFFGFNRAKHAVVEAAVLATRLSLLPRDFVDAELQRLAPLVDKTGGPAERRAFAILRQFVSDSPEHAGG